jgi:hypothetical protein
VVGAEACDRWYKSTNTDAEAVVRAEHATHYIIADEEKEEEDERCIHTLSY